MLLRPQLLFTIMAVCLTSVHLLAQEKGTAGEPVKSLPSAEQVIERYVKLVGGFERLQSIESVHCQMSVTSLNESGITFQYEGFRENDLYFEKYLGSDGRTRERGHKAGISWERTNGRLREFVGSEITSNTRFGRDRLEAASWLDTCRKIECKNRQTIRGRETFHLHFVYEDGKTSEKYFDVESGLLIQSVDDTIYNSAPMRIVCEVLEYEQSGEQLIFKKMRMAYGNKIYLFDVDYYEFDVKIPSQTFDLPSVIQARIK